MAIPAFMENNLASFTAKARVIDLLGREQIADAPTAISELFKNAIDAAADGVTLRYWTGQKVLELEDSGLGMRTSDLLSKWLVVATDSKRGILDSDWMRFATQKQRKALQENKPFGEKGIGRLAVSSLGRAVIVWTRWGASKEAQNTLMFVHWDLFRHSRLTLDDIKIPYVTFNGDAATEEDAVGLFDSLASRLESASGWDRKEEIVLKEQILSDLKKQFPESIKGNFSAKTTTGTQFTILGTSPEVEEALRPSQKVAISDSEDVSDGLKMLMAFSDPFGNQARKLAIRVEIDGKPFLDNQRFWQAEDLEKADHYLDLEFRADGFVSGKVRRFSETFEYTYQISELGPRSYLPGPFQLRLGYIAGDQRESKLSPEQWNLYHSRLRAFGALYVYRDGVRLLPYGRTDHDFLEFEVRRSHNAGRYFFSHRRMFGAIYLTSNDNQNLREKAGREGFIKNGAYRGFTESLVAVFIDLAKTYFATDPLIAKADRRGKRKQDAAERLRKRAEQEKELFFRGLEMWRRKLPVARSQMQRLFDDTEAQIKNAQTEIGHKQQRVQAAYKLVDRGREEFAAMVAELGTEPPSLTALSRTEQQVFDSYLTDRQAFEEETIKKLANYGARCGQIAKSLIPESDRQQWARQQITDATGKADKALTDELTEVGLLCEHISQQYAKEWKSKHIEALKNIIDHATGESSEPDSPEQHKLLVEALARMEIELREVQIPFWRSVKTQLEAIQEAEGSEELLGNLHRRTEIMEERARVLGELAQLGLVVESLDHEYRSLFYNVEQSLKSISSYIRPEGEKALRTLVASIESLETKQNLLTPLHQHRTSTRFDISGTDIQNFIERLYPESRRQGTKVEFSPDFSKLVLKNASQATIFASTSNLIANSLYWVSRTSRTRVIRLTTMAGGIVISDSGPGIAPRDRSRIFEAFFGRRPNGRGLGLYIAKTNLEATGYELNLLDTPPPNALPGAVFYISPAT